MEDTNLTIAKIAHEIRNPLTLINSSLQLIETMHPEVKDFQFWSQTLDDVEYLNQLLDELSLYSDNRRFFMCEVNLKEIFSSLEESLQPYVMAEKKNFSVHLPSQLPSVFGNPVKLKQAFLNLLKTPLNLPEKTAAYLCLPESIWIRLLSASLTMAAA